MRCRAVPGAAQQAVLNFGQVADAIMVGEGGRLSLYNLTLVNAAQRSVPNTDSHARYKIVSFGPWPSLTVLPNATVRRPPCRLPDTRPGILACRPHPGNLFCRAWACRDGHPAGEVSWRCVPTCFWVVHLWGHNVKCLVLPARHAPHEAEWTSSLTVPFSILPKLLGRARRSCSTTRTTRTTASRRGASAAATCRSSPRRSRTGCPPATSPRWTTAPSAWPASTAT